MPPSDPGDLRPDIDIDVGTAHGPDRFGTVLLRNPKTGARQLGQLVWGLLPHDTKDPANAPRPIMARAETVATHPLFASAFLNRRAIVPMSYYYQRSKITGSAERFAISRHDGEPMAVAGLWEWFKRPNSEILRTYCVITTVANSLVAPINDRMLVLLDRQDWPVWLGEQPSDPAPLLHPPPVEVLQCRPISDRRTKRQRDLF